MASDRLKTLLKFAEQNPNDAFVRYGLAQEYVNAGQLDEAVKEFNRLLEGQPDYQAAYYHLGQTYFKLDRKEDARETFQKGIELAKRTGDTHAQSELEDALEEL